MCVCILGNTPCDHFVDIESHEMKCSQNEKKNTRLVWENERGKQNGQREWEAAKKKKEAEKNWAVENSVRN